jgi:hypothetical protein
MEERDGERRFMEREHLQNLDVNWGHEPEVSKSLKIRRGLFRFMESSFLATLGFGPESRWDSRMTQPEKCPNFRRRTGVRRNLTPISGAPLGG